MMNEIEVFKQHLIKLRSDPYFKKDAIQIKVKSFLAETTGEIPNYGWKYIVYQIIRYLTISHFELSAILNNEDTDDFSNLSLLFAQVWESLAFLQERTTKDTALINAALNYELAGYQANSMCIAKKLLRNPKSYNSSPLYQLSILFLARKFFKVRNLAVQLQKPPTVLDLNSNLSILDKMGEALAGWGFFYISSYFLTGIKENFKLSEQYFEDSLEVFNKLSFVEESNLVRNVRNLLKILDRRSIWEILGNILEGNFRWQRYLKLLARGYSSHLIEANSVSELWNSQILAINARLFDFDINSIVRMPTSAGKTRIAEMLIAYTLIKYPNSKCIYIAPYRALVTEISQNFSDLFSDLGFRVTKLIGSYESDDLEELLVKETDLIITTPEKLDLMFRLNPEFLLNVKLLVFDEFQLVNEKSRGKKYELLINRLKRKLVEVKILILTAVISHDYLEDLARWLNSSSENGVIQTDWRPSVQRFGILKWLGTKGIIEYAPDIDVNIIGGFAPGIITQNIYKYINPDTGRSNTKKFPENYHKAQIAIELSFKLAELGPVLIFTDKPKSTEDIANAFHYKLQLLNLSDEIPPTWVKINEKTQSYILAREWLGSSHIVTRSLRLGLAIHHGELPDVVKNAIENDFRQKKFRLIVATTTLAQGVNLPIRTVIIHSCWRYNSANDRMERIKAREYWNIAGRAGRAGEETSGQIIHIKTRPVDEKNFKYYLSCRKEVEYENTALFDFIVEIISSRIFDESLYRELDPEILAILVEEGIETLDETSFDSIYNDSLVKIQALRLNNESIHTKFKEIFLDIGTKILCEIGDPEMRKLYSTTGLSSRSCLTIAEEIEKNRDNIRSWILENTSEINKDFLNFILSTSFEISEMEVPEEFGGSYQELLINWINGCNINDLIEMYKEIINSVEDFAKIIDKFITYRLPWGTSAILRISKKLLEINNSEIPDQIKYLPSIIKYGVPDHIAAWVMAIGIPFRDLAIKIAEKFRIESETLNYRAFFDWLGTINVENLLYDFKIKGAFLNEISKAISVATSNPIFQACKNFNESFPYVVEVKGIQYENRSIVANSTKIGMKVHIIRDLKNTYDRNAIQIQTENGDILGYVPKDVAQFLATEMDAGIEIFGEICKIEKLESVTRIWVKLSLEQPPSPVRS